jgi:hypothetical protein
LRGRDGWGEKGDFYIMQEKKELTDELSAKKEKINEQVIKMKNYSDLLFAVIGKEDLTEAEISNAFDYADEIQTASEEAIMLLFELKDIILKNPS